jgi:SagB-type dehydrogenase family enzyme
MEPLTVRLTGERIVVSTDDGRTAEPDADAAASLRLAISEALARLKENAWTFGRPTAATLAAVGEARVLMPRKSSAVTSVAEPRANHGERTRLASLVQPTRRPFADVLASRRSERSFAPITLTELASVLVPSARIQDWWEAPDGYAATERPTPSAGGRFPLDLVILALDVHGLEPGLWHLDAAHCDLVRTETSNDSARAALGKVRAALEGNATPAAAIFATANFGRTLRRYPNGMSLVFRDAGALLATMHLCASGVGLHSCIVGTAGALVYEVGETLVADIGALLIGGPGESKHPKGSQRSRDPASRNSGDFRRAY